MAGERVAVVVARFYADLAQRLTEGALAELAEHGAQGEVFEVPGAFELPLAARWAASSGSYQAVVCLGAVIKGETDHYEFVCAEAARGVQEVSLRTGVPCAFGVLTCRTYDQALARADGSKRDQGRLAARAALEMVRLRRRIAEPASRDLKL
jgi:6,7-dimethyl-8-ribityllumazine synthase